MGTDAIDGLMAGIGAAPGVPEGGNCRIRKAVMETMSRHAAAAMAQRIAGHIRWMIGGLWLCRIRDNAFSWRPEGACNERVKCPIMADREPDNFCSSSNALRQA